MSIVELPRFHPMSEELEIDEAINVPITVQRQKLDDSLKKVAYYGYHMQKQLELDNFKEGLKHAEDMLNELRTGALLPKFYFQLCIFVTSHKIDLSILDQLQYLSLFFRDETRKKKEILSYYERVQYCPRILPRLYLLITVGAQIIKSKERPANELLNDLIEMCKGVQHPTRGLFLRGYLLQNTRDKLPDRDNDFSGTCQNSIDFILLNMKEMVNLWARLKKDQEKEREKERQDLSDVVGSNVNRLAKLEGLDLQFGGMEIYRDTVLPKLVSIIVDSKDAMAQQYLMDCVIQAFPDEYHIETLENLCAIILKLDKNVNFKIIFTSLMGRLANFIASSLKPVEKAGSLIEILTKNVMLTIEKQIPSEDALAIQSSLIALSLRCFPKNMDFVTNILAGCANICSSLSSKGNSVAVVELLKVPLICPLLLFEMDKYLEIYTMLSWSDKKTVSIAFAKTLLQNRVILSTPRQVTRLFELLEPLVKDEREDSEAPVVNDELEEQQTWVGRLLHSIQHSDPDAQFKLLGYARKTFGQGGLIRIQYTLPSLVFAYLDLSTKSENEKISTYVIEIIKVLAQNYPRIAFKLFLDTALASDNKKIMKNVSVTLSEAFTLYEAEDPKTQPDSLKLLINVLMKLKNLKTESFEKIAAKLCQYSAKLANKKDQCRVGLLCSQLFWCDNSKNGEKGIECLNWALQIVKTCQSIEQIPLLIDVLNAYILHFELKNSVKPEAINALLSLIKTNILELEDEDPEKTGLSVRNYYLSTMGYLKMRKGIAIEYKEIKI